MGVLKEVQSRALKEGAQTEARSSAVLASTSASLIIQPCTLVFDTMTLERPTHCTPISYTEHDTMNFKPPSRQVSTPLFPNNRTNR